MLKKIRYEEEEKLCNNLNEWLATDTILALMEKCSPNEDISGLPPGYTLITNALPKFHNLIQDLHQRLGLENGLADFYIRTNNNLAPQCHLQLISPQKKPRIILSEPLIKLLSDDELRAVIAHELAHIHYGHHLLAMCINWLNLDDKKGRIYALANLYHYWQQLAELNADFVSLLVVDDPKNVITSLARCNLRSLASDLSFTPFLKEQHDRLQKGELFINRDLQHPPWEYRAIVLDLFLTTSFFQEIKTNQKNVSAFPEKIIQLTDYLKVSSANDGDFLEFSFLLTAGNFLIGADDQVHKTEINRLLDILARLIHAPNKDFIFSSKHTDYTAAMLQLGEQIRVHRPERVQPIFELISTLMAQDGRIAPEEKKALDEIAQALQIPERAAAKIILKVLRQEFHPAIKN